MRRQLAESWDQISAEAGFCFSFRAGTRPPANQTNCPQRPSAEVLMKSLAAVLESELAALAFGSPREIHNATWLCLMRFGTE
jgi:hypothetical protein